MGIKAKGRTLFRIIGSIFILIGLVTSIVFRISLFYNFIAYLIVYLIILPWFLFSIFLKLELGFFTDNVKKISLFLIVFSIILLFICFIWDLSSVIMIILDTFSLSLLLCCWHFSLSIYKQEKILFLMSGFVYIIDTIIYDLYINLQNHLILILDVIFVSLGILIILLIEFNLRKKGFLNYI